MILQFGALSTKLMEIFNPSDPDGFLLHLCPEGVLNLTLSNKFTKFSFFYYQRYGVYFKLKINSFCTFKIRFWGKLIIKNLKNAIKRIASFRNRTRASCVASKFSIHKECNQVSLSMKFSFFGVISKKA